MSDFSHTDLLDAVDRAVTTVLARHSVTGPPVDAVALAQEAFGMTVREDDPEEDEPRAGRFGPQPPRRRRRGEIVLRADLSDEARNNLCARACAKELAPAILEKLGVVAGTENRGAVTQLMGLIAPRLLLPSRWFERAARKAGFDLYTLKEDFATVGYEMLALRMLDIEDADPFVISVVDDGTVGLRRGNRAAVTKVLVPTERTCLERVLKAGEPQSVRSQGWSVRGWPIPTGPFNRIILRAVPDEL